VAEVLISEELRRQGQGLEIDGCGGNPYFSYEKNRPLVPF